jgi:hypothetical protein
MLPAGRVVTSLQAIVLLGIPVARTQQSIIMLKTVFASQKYNDIPLNTTSKER